MKITYSFFTLNVALLVLIGAFAPPVAAEGLYKWVDKQGNVTYQSSPPPDDAADVERSKISIDNANEPADEEVTERPSIEFYSEVDCDPCSDARTYLSDLGVTFEEFDITGGSTEADEMQTKLGHNNVPTIIVGDRTITGFNKTIMDNIMKNAGFDLPEEE